MSEEEGFQQDMIAREREAIEALNRCARAGADIDALKTLAREAGIDIKNTILGDEIKAR